MSDEIPAATHPAGPAASSSKMVPLLVGVNTLIVAGVLALQFFHPGASHAATTLAKHEGKSSEHGEGKEGEGSKEGGGEEGASAAETANAGTPVGPTVKMPEFVIHLRNPEVDRYVRLTFEVEVQAEKDKTDLTAQMPRIRDAFISYLSDRTVEELRGSEGLEKTKQALLGRFIQVAPSVRAKALYITDLVIQ